MILGLISVAILFGVHVVDPSNMIPNDIYMWPFWLGIGWTIIRVISGTVVSGFNQLLDWDEPLSPWEITCILAAIAYAIWM